MTTTRLRGACPDALAEEVHRRTMAGVMSRFASGRHKQTVGDAVTEAFVYWYGSDTDKTTHAGGEHAHWLIRTATAYILNRSRHPGGRHVRPCASWAAPNNADDGNDFADREASRLEGIYRAFYDVADPSSHEANLLGALDDVDAMFRGRVCITWRQALDALFARGWSRAQVAAAMAVSYQSVQAWAIGTIVPHPDRREELITLAATDAPVPPPITPLQASRVAKRPPRPRPEPARRRPPKPPPPPPDESWRQVMAIVKEMIGRGDAQVVIAQTLGVTKQVASTWARGANRPSPAMSARVLAYVAQNAK